jgi:hypothetical protein
VQSVKDPAVKLSQRRNNFVRSEGVPVNVDPQTTVRNALSGISQRPKRHKKAKINQSSKKIGNTVGASEAATAAAFNSTDGDGDGDGDDDNEEHDLPWFVPQQYTITLPSGQQRSYELNNIQRMFVMITDSSSW